jgi:hypothetical protein
MNLSDRIEIALRELTTNPREIDLSSVSQLLSDIRETIGDGLDRVTAENSLSQLGAASNDSTQKISVLEKELATYRDLLDSLKNSLIGKIDILYKNSPLKSDILSELTEESLSIKAFLKLRSQIEHQFNTSWLPEANPVRLSKGQVINPANSKSGGNPWHHE